VRELLHRLVDLRDHEPTLTNAEAGEHLPEYSVWQARGELPPPSVQPLARIHDAATVGGYHPFRASATAFRRSVRLRPERSRGSSRSNCLMEIETALGGRLAAKHWDTLKQIEELFRFCGDAQGRFGGVTWISFPC